MNVNVLCRNPRDDRVIPRFARYLRDTHGWTLTARPDPHADVVYLSGYFESQVAKPWPSVPVAAYFTHREVDGDGKARLFDQIAERVQLRIATAAIYAEYLETFGPTVQIRPPVERERFVIPGRDPSKRRVGMTAGEPVSTRVIKRPLVAGGQLTAGLCGFTYRTGRKGGDLADLVVKSPVGRRLTWRASGRGWPIRTEKLHWREMPAFMQSLDILVVTSLIEGVPMPPLEALSCGVSVVVPREVGLLDELGRTESGQDILGIHRYARGDAEGLIAALEEAVAARGKVNREALRKVTALYTIENWCEQHKRALEALVEGPDAGLAEEDVAVARPVKIKSIPEPVARDTGSARGIYCVAFGDPARSCAKKMMATAKQHMPEIPICLCSDRKIGGEDVLVKQPDGPGTGSDIGGRRAKLKAYALAPAEWEAVLYLDADTEVVGDIRFYFQLIEDGWEFVICKDPHLMDTMHAFRRRNNLEELDETAEQIHTMHTLQYNGGVWAFGRNERVARFFARWLAEWERHAQRDQGALIRAMYTEPLRVYLLGNEWNTFPKYTRGIVSAGLMHYPGRARRWKGMIPGRIDSQTAWRAVERFMARQ